MMFNEGIWRGNLNSSGVDRAELPQYAFFLQLVCRPTNSFCKTKTMGFVPIALIFKHEKHLYT